MGAPGDMLLGAERNKPGPKGPTRPPSTPKEPLEQCDSQKQKPGQRLPGAGEQKREWCLMGAGQDSKQVVWRTIVLPFVTSLCYSGLGKQKSSPSGPHGETSANLN